MPEQITITVYEFSELSEASKAKAIQTLRDDTIPDNWYESTYEDAE